MEERGSTGKHEDVRGKNFPVLPLSSLFSLFFRVIVGGVLIYAGFSKAVAPSAEFAAALAAYKILPSSLLSPIALVWPWLELIVGTYLLFGFNTRHVARAAAGLFGIFLGVLVSAIARGIDPGSCGCFGIGINLSVHQTAALDAILLVLSFLTARFSGDTPAFSVDRWIQRT
jgi:uncharacterized membrane protein YphA (DoxX/SURF4 family)